MPGPGNPRMAVPERCVAPVRSKNRKRLHLVPSRNTSCFTASKIWVSANIEVKVAIFVATREQNLLRASFSSFSFFPFSNMGRGKSYRLSNAVRSQYCFLISLLKKSMLLIFVKSLYKTLQITQKLSEIRYILRLNILPSRKNC